MTVVGNGGVEVVVGISLISNREAVIYACGVISPLYGSFVKSKTCWVRENGPFLRVYRLVVMITEALPLWPH